MTGKTVVCIGGVGRGIAEAAVEVGANMIVTPRTQQRVDEAAVERAKTRTGRIVTPLDLGRVAAPLTALPAVAGAAIPVDGGRHRDNAE